MPTKDSIYVQERVYFKEVDSCNEEISYYYKTIVPWKFILVYEVPSKKLSIITNPEILERANIRLIKNKAAYPENPAKKSKKSIHELEEIIAYFADKREKEQTEAMANFEEMMRLIGGLPDLVGVIEGKDYTDEFKVFRFYQ